MKRTATIAAGVLALTLLPALPAQAVHRDTTPNCVTRYEFENYGPQAGRTRLWLRRHFGMGAVVNATGNWPVGTVFTDQFRPCKSLGGQAVWARHYLHWDGRKRLARGGATWQA